jgi:hypothetical protein
LKAPVTAFSVSVAPWRVHKTLVTDKRRCIS